MSNDDVERELRASLARHAQDAPRGDLLAERIVSAAGSAAERADAASRRHRSFRTWTLPLIAAGAVAAAVVAGVAVQALQPDGGHHRQPAATGTNQLTPPASPSPTASPSRPEQVTGGDLTGIRIRDVTYYDRNRGWALGSADCTTGAPGRCPALLRTDDGTTWTAVGGFSFNVPEQTGGCDTPCVTNIRFANAATGYAFGPAALFMTTDGGRSWRRQKGPGALALESLHDNVIRVSAAGGGEVRVSTSGIGSRHWQSSDLTAPAQRVVLSRGSADYLLLTRPGQPSALYRSLDRGRHWTALGEPCPSATASTVAAGVNQGVSVLCAATDGSKFVATSGDGGAHFVAGDPVPADATLLTGDPGTVLVVAGNGLERSTDGGRGWTEIADVTGTVGFVGFETDKFGRAVSADGRTIWTTRNGGRDWRAVTLR